jgi:ketosteroid isomerase-like protein
VKDFDEAFARRDIEAALPFYEEGAALVIEPGDIALFTSRWRFEGTSPDGRRRMIIDNSRGPAVLEGPVS